MPKLEEITFFLHKERHATNTANLSPETSLLQYLRDYEKLTGTKYMCLEGGCGACTVAVTEEHPITKKMVTFSVNSCLVSVYSCQGWRIHTADGIGNNHVGFHPIQQTLAKFGGTQCGFCTPGMVMNMYSLYQKNNLTAEQIENSFGGNICRCTGYRPILAAFKSLITNNDIVDIEDLGKRKCTIPCTKINTSKWFKVFTINEIFDIFDQNPQKTYRLVAGNTAQGIYPITSNPDIYIDIRGVVNLINDYESGNTLIVGANKTLNDTMELFNRYAQNTSGFAYLAKLAEHISLVAHVPVRNIGTLAGNLSIKHEHNEFSSDIFLILETVGSKLTIVNRDRRRSQYSLTDFLTYDMNRKVIQNIILPKLSSSSKFGSYKIMPRAQNAFALVNAGFLLEFTDSNTIKSASIVYGGINPTFVHAKKTETYLIGKNVFDNGTLQETFAILSSEIEPNDSLPLPSAEFRKQLAISLFYKFVLSISSKNILSPENVSGGTILTRPLSSGQQDFQTNQSTYPITEPIPKIEALQQTSGQLQYVLDIPKYEQELHASFVLAKAPSGSIIKRIDTSIALNSDGVISYFDKNDVPGRNTFAPVELNYPAGSVDKDFLEEELFCSGTVQYYNQPVGIIVAKTQEIADRAVDLVNIEYTSSNTKPLLTIEDILSTNATSKIITEATLNATSKGTDVTKVVKGTFQTGHQYHYHMETQICLVLPRYDGFDVYAGTQWKDHVQVSIGIALNININRINVIVHQIGGAFGGKSTRNSMLACASAIAAHKLNVPIRCRMSFSTNMDVMGKRYPTYGKYEVGVNNTGQIQYLNCTSYTDYGKIGNQPIAGSTSRIFYNSYKHDTWTLNTNSTRTDTAPAQYARAPGHSTTLALIESIMEHIATELNLSAPEIRKVNMDPIDNKKILQYIEEIERISNYNNCRELIEDFNTKNRWKKRGMSLVQMIFPLQTMSNLTALVSIYAGDGTVSVTHGAIEMGQGINTKVAQVCAYAFKISLDMVTIKESVSTTSPNNFATATNTTSEGICYATLQACQILLDRMKPIKDKMKSPTWVELVKQCQLDYVDLMASYMFSPKDLPRYDIYGVCVTEVEVDVLTGQHQIIRVDLIEDVGNTMNPYVDIGQIEGAFVMGLGLWTTEKTVYDTDGKLFTNRTLTYQTPGALDIPADFRITIPKNNPNKVGVFGSKAVGEPPLCLACSVAFAIRNAVASARTSSNLNASKWYPMNGPSSVEDTFMNCLNDYQQFKL